MLNRLVPSKAQVVAPTTNAIECRDLWKVFGHKPNAALWSMVREGLSKDQVFKKFNCVVAVNDVSLSIPRGKVFCIMGLSGSGKSTVLRHINGLIKPTAGTIHLGGIDLSAQTEAELRRIRATKTGMVFQHFGLLPHRSVIENVAFGLELRGEPLETSMRIAEQKLSLVGLEGWEDRATSQLSGGMQQRVGIARALASDPEILLMDEPFSALDPLIRRQLQDQFIDLSKSMRKTTVFITHDLEEAMRLGDRIAIMRDGRVVQVGSPKEIILAPIDEYVASFVGGMSLMNVLTLGDICKRTSDGLSGPRTSAATSLAEAITLCLASEGPLVVTDESENAIGLVDRDLLLSHLKPNRGRHDG